MILRVAGLIYATHKGQYLHYRLNTSGCEDILGWTMHLLNKSEAT
ncbi:MAG: hypothetical protein PWP64_387 [Candidatus Cloacimonadota bacterium]|nr:hypothetical protein [Candidatus Cloacimonadota bacterium]